MRDAVDSTVVYQSQALFVWDFFLAYCKQDDSTLSGKITVYLCLMNPAPENVPPPWLGLIGWLPIIIYFLVKYVVIGRENMTSRQSWLLIGSVILAEVALWQYRRQFRKKKNPEENGPS